MSFWGLHQVTVPSGPSVLGVFAAVACTISAELYASDVLRYRAIPIGEVIVPQPGVWTSPIGEVLRWPSPSFFGSGARFRFISPKRLIGTVAVRMADGSSVRRAIVVDYDLAATRWVTRELPLAPGALESIAMDANESAVVVGACVFPEDQAHPARIIGSIWQLSSPAEEFASPTLLLEGESLCNEQFWFVHSILSAIGPSDSNGFCFAAGVAHIDCFQDTSLPFGLTWQYPTAGPLISPAGVETCTGISGLCLPTNPLARPVGYADAVGWNTEESLSVVFGAAGKTLSGISTQCVYNPDWTGIRWRSSDGETQPVRRASVCTDDGRMTLPPVELPDGTQANLRWVHISSIGTMRLGEVDAPIAAGALGIEALPGSDCQSYDCFPVHGAVFVHPFADEADVVTFDIHQSIVDRPDQGSLIYQSSAVARVEETLSKETDCLVVGARGQDWHPKPTDCEGVIWGGKFVDSTYAWCGRSMADDLVIQRRAFLGHSQSPEVGFVTTDAVHDILSNGVAVGVGSLQVEAAPSSSQLVLLTEACDINGDHMVDQKDSNLLLLNWRRDNNPCDLTGDGIVNDRDYRILLQAIGVSPAGRQVLIEDICGEYWAKTPPLPYTAAAYAFGFQDFSQFGDYAAALDPDQAVVLGCSVTVVAQALQEQGE